MNCIALHEIDQAISPLVARLQDFGFDTFLACEGGEGHEFALPTVKIKSDVNLDEEGKRLVSFLIDQGLHHFTARTVSMHQKTSAPMPESFLEVQFWSKDDLTKLSDR